MARRQTMAAPGHVTAVLGPTNTGKTHLAVERMLGHESGIIGLPLRLLAREIYDRIVERRGVDCVALVTGEEKIVPPEPAYFVCTVEAMPLERDFAFVAIDEIQLAADPERGHVFTDRILNARGTQETMLLGADTMRGVVQRLLPGVRFQERPRFSSLTWADRKKLSRLPRRSAVVAFSAAEVYAVAELIRRQRGGAAVVMGALSPRTRNAQVELFEAGEVDYLVATDAIGMGLNLNVDHVAFAGFSKFDGRFTRDLTPAEAGQIAGRAGRHMNDGTFGVTGDAPDPAIELIERVEQHRFKPVRTICWRNAEPDVSSTTALQLCLEAPPPARFRDILTKPWEGADLEALKRLLSDSDIAAAAKGKEATSLLWQVCQIPDFRKTMVEAHVRLLARIFGHLAESGRLPTDWVADHLKRLDRSEGDIDTLATRLAHIRTWTFVSHRADWLDDSPHWQAQARAIEDRLSDALHQRLTQRFVDQRSAALLRRLDEGAGIELLGGVAADGAVSVEGHGVGHLEGFRFVADGGQEGAEGSAEQVRTLRNAAAPIVAAELVRRVRSMEMAADEDFSMDAAGRLVWRHNGTEHAVGRITAGRIQLQPGVGLLTNDLEETERRQVTARLELWLAAYVERQLKPLFNLGKPFRGTSAETPDHQTLSAAGRGLAFQLQEALGVLPRATVADQVKSLSGYDRYYFRQRGVTIGAQSVFLPALLKPAKSALRALLWAVQHGCAETCSPPPASLVSVPCGNGLPDGYYGVCGYRVFGARAVRIDMVERLVAALRKNGAIEVVPDHELLSLVGCSRPEFGAVMKGLGYKSRRRQALEGDVPDEDSDKVTVYFQRREKPARKKPARKKADRPRVKVDPDSPFAVLKDLVGDR